MKRVVNDQREQRNVVKGINFHRENFFAHAYRDAKCASVCVSV